MCVDFGSTFTKVVVVGHDGQLIATGSSRTTVDTDVMDGLGAALADAAVKVTDETTVLACSSAGGGLRIAVIGYERAVTAEAGYRVGLSAGGRVCHVASGQLDAAAIVEVLEARPDVLLLVGGTDGGNAEVLVHNAHMIARASLGLPVVIAGNVEARDHVRRILRRAKVTVTAADNVLPRIGALDPRSARGAIREAFITHVIGGKNLSTRVDLATFVQAATPDAVLAGVELLADGADLGDIVVVDVGGATTDVYSVTSPEPDETPEDHDVVATMWRSRTVEGDLGVRWNAPGIVEAAEREGLLAAAERDSLHEPAQLRHDNPGYVPASDAEREIDHVLARLAATIALRRHAKPHQAGQVSYPGKNLSQVRLVVGSGGVLRHCEPQRATALVRDAIDDPAGGWRVPEQATTAVDTHYVLAAAGLIGRTHPAVAARLLSHSLRNR